MESSKEEQKEVEKRTRRKSIIIIIIFLIAVHIILNLIKVPVEVIVQEPYIAEYTATEVVMGEENYLSNECNEIVYDYDRQWISTVQEDAFGYVTPELQVTNLEDERSGFFGVQFAFYNDGDHDYDNYRNRAYTEFSDELSWNDADFFSIVREYQIEPRKSISVRLPTLKIDLNSEYWALGDVFPPNYTKCDWVPKKRPAEIFQNITKYRNDTRDVLEKVNKTLWQLIMEVLFSNNEKNADQKNINFEEIR